MDRPSARVCTLPSEMEIVNVMPAENQSVLPRVVQRSTQIRMLGLVAVQKGAGADPMLAV